MEYVKICGRVADRLGTKGYGKRDKKCLLLSYEEALYLSENGLVELEFPEVFRQAAEKVENFDIRFFVYRDLRARGYVIKVEESHYSARKNYAMDFYPISDTGTFNLEHSLKRELPFVLAVVDGDGDVTYYMVDEAEPEGENHEHPRVHGVIPAGNRVFMLEGYDSLGTFGKVEGRFAHLSSTEAKYLNPKVNVEVDENIYHVYADLRKKGLVVKSGFKYGTHFRVYVRSLEEHSRYLVHVLAGDEDMQRLSRAVRVAHGVRKTLLFAGRVGNEIRYISVTWIRP